jgi:serine/threonine-protein kinase
MSATGSFEEKQGAGIHLDLSLFREEGLAIERQPIAPGATIAGKYRLEQLLAEGGMGSVWRAVNVQLGLPVAVKCLRPTGATAELKSRLRNEARAAAKLVHPNIVRVFDIGELETGEPFIVMELLTGQSLSHLIKERPLPAEYAVDLLLPVIEALELAHAKGIVHRDLKPDNIYLALDSDRFRPKLLDFGIAKIKTAPELDEKLTQAGTILGSPDYMSPEQARGSEQVDERTDIWSICVVLYEMTAGVPPFSGQNYNALLRNIVEQEPQPLPELAGVDEGLWQILRRGLNKDRAQRYASMAELGSELSRWRSASNSARARGSLVPQPAAGARPSALPTQRYVVPAPRLDRETLVSVTSANSDNIELGRFRRVSASAFRNTLAGVAAVMMAVAGFVTASASTRATAARPAAVEADPARVVTAAHAHAAVPATRQVSARHDEPSEVEPTAAQRAQHRAAAVLPTAPVRAIRERAFQRAAPASKQQAPASSATPAPRTEHAVAEKPSARAALSDLMQPY